MKTVANEQGRELKTQNEVLFDLAMSLRHPATDFSKSLRTIARSAARFIGVSRLGIWQFTADGHCLECLALFDGEGFVDAPPLFRSDFPEYFSACQTARSIDADDAVNDPRTREFSEIYLNPLGITSMLDCPFFSGEVCRGVVCAEHIGKPRHWSEREKAFMASVADLVSLAVASRDRVDALRHIEALLDTAPQGVLVLDASGHVTRVNQMSQTLFGGADDSLLGQPVRHLLQCDDPSLEQIFGVADKLSDPMSGRHEFIMQGHSLNGRQFPASVTIGRMTQQDDEYLLLLVCDISDRVAIEQRLRQSERLYRSVVEDQTDLILRIDRQGRMTFVNQTVCDYFDVDPALPDPVSTFDYVPEEDHHVIRESSLAISPDNPVVHYEHHCHRSDGTRPLIAWTLRGFFDENDQVTGYQAIGHDITVRKLRDARLAEAERLESLALLSGGMAHDFNNLLSPILGDADMMLAHSQLDPTDRKRLQRIMKSAERASELLQHLMMFSRQERSEDRKPLLIAPLIREILDFVRGSAGSRVTLNVEVDSYCGAVVANPSDIFQIMSNLCANALHAMPAGGNLDVNASRISRDDRPWVQIIVRDNGPGISEAHRKQIFHPYFTTKTSGKGTGLGLSVVHSRVAELGGRIELDSKPGLGTTFVVLLPIEESTVEEDIHFEGSKSFAGTESLLVVDDDSGITGMLTDGLEQLGYSITARNSANEALAALQADPDQFDLILTDYTMPYMSGTELAWTARQMRGDLPIVLMTGFGQLISDADLKHGGIEDFVAKPFRIEDVARQVRQAIDRANEDPGPAGSG